MAQDEAGAFKWYRKAADQGFAAAQSNLGLAYELGRGGLMKDDREAVRLYKLAADQGNAFAQAQLGLFYEQGRGGLMKDGREAARLYKLAADQGNIFARMQLARSAPSSAEALKPGPSSVEASKLGLSLAPARNGGEGVAVTKVDPNGLAGGQFQTGDVILDINGKSVSSPADLGKAVSDAQDDGKRVVLMRVKSGQGTHFVAVPMDNASRRILSNTATGLPRHP